MCADFRCQYRLVIKINAPDLFNALILVYLPPRRHLQNNAFFMKARNKTHIAFHRPSSSNSSDCLVSRSFRSRFLLTRSNFWHCHEYSTSVSHSPFYAVLTQPRVSSVLCQPSKLAIDANLINYKLQFYKD